MILSGVKISLTSKDKIIMEKPKFPTNEFINSSETTINLDIGCKKPKLATL
jgi:hypothetical protein